MTVIFEDTLRAMGNFSKKMRKDLDCTLFELSKILGICDKTIHRLESYQYLNLYNALSILIPFIVYFSKEISVPIIQRVILKHGANITHREVDEFSNLSVKDALQEIVENLHDDCEKRKTKCKTKQKLAEHIQKRRKKNM